MATQTVGKGVGTGQSAAAYERFAGACAILAGLGSLAYSVAFVILKNVGIYSALLMFGGLVTAAVLVGVFSRVRAAGAELAGLALLLGVVGAMGSLSHGAYDLANAIHPEASPAQVLKATSSQALATLPDQIDARGVMTFGIAGVAILLFSWLIVRSGAGVHRTPLLPRGLGYLGYVLGVLLVIVYLGRLIVLDPTSSTGTIAILAPAALTGLIVNPVWLFWLGAALLRRRHVSA